MSDDLKLCLKVLDEAILFEDESMRFFKEREKSAPAEMERSIFRSLVKDEAGHKAYLIKLREGLAASGNLSAMKADDENAARHTARQIFEGALESVEDSDPMESDDLEVLRGAMEAERRGYRLYTKAAASIASPRAKEIFEHLASEEVQHYQLLKNTFDYLSDPQGFTAFDEGAMLDGG